MVSPFLSNGWRNIAPEIKCFNYKFTIDYNTAPIENDTPVERGLIDQLNPTTTTTTSPIGKFPTFLPGLPSPGLPDTNGVKPMLILGTFQAVVVPFDPKIIGTIMGGFPTGIPSG